MMILMKKPALLAAIPATMALADFRPAQAQQAAVADKAADTSGESDSDLAKKVQNPIGDLVTFPFQSNTNFGVGPHNGAQEILNIQPVIPFHLNENWNVITRTILPLVWNPEMSPLPSADFGASPTGFSAFLTPSHPTNGWLWGLGPVVQVPTITSPYLGSSVWGGGPTGVLVYMKGPWVAGALVNNIWSFGGTSGRFGNGYSNFLTQLFVNYNFSGGWYLTSAPIITANWDIPGTKWTVPIGGGVGRLIKIGKQPVNLMVGAYYNVIKPDLGPDWQLRTQVIFVF